MTKVSVFENFLSPDDLFNVKELSNEIYYSPDHCKSTNAGWTKAVIGNSFPVVCCKIEDEKLLEVLQKKIDETANVSVRWHGRGEYEIKSASFFYWTEFSYIPWHDDAGHDAAMTIYLSGHDENDGGYFMYKRQEEIVAIPPVMNRAILQVEGVPHSTTALNSRSPIRKTIQIFLQKKTK